MVRTALYTVQVIAPAGEPAQAPTLSIYNPQASLKEDSSIALIHDGSINNVCTLVSPLFMNTAAVLLSNFLSHNVAAFVILSQTTEASPTHHHRHHRHHRHWWWWLACHEVLHAGQNLASQALWRGAKSLALHLYLKLAFGLDPKFPLNQHTYVSSPLNQHTYVSSRTYRHH